jgi:hypothetical protein
MVREDGAIVLSDSSIPEKYRVRYWSHTFPAGSSVNVQIWWQIDNYHGQDHYDSFIRSVELSKFPEPSPTKSKRR